MNYRHAFHAGSAADVLKHVVLLETLDLVLAKPKPLFVLDTHAGEGLYRLTPQGEADDGIRRLWGRCDTWPMLRGYCEAVGRFNGTHLRDYPGSPLLIAGRLRAQDRLVAVEEATATHAVLQQVLRAPHSQIFLGNGYHALKALLPPRERRAVILIDPPYERVTERSALLAGLKTALQRFRQGIFLVWYPIKDAHDAERLVSVLSALGENLCVELLTWPADIKSRLNGSGLLILNPPYGLRKKLGEVIPPLAQILTRDGTPRYRIR
ncbi:23S rRNA (adenine(2030)-N(6))-methyltransferase RlmJ [Acidiferrobacter sp.]|uniref:23S rRNA (adenine(2030)-N(6))-methyltransferase RlmJ n=1 Tax=Acidiferrobacter sp. TaxID=1872107 RepID=UPI00262ECFAE|nr:23S rRNA (adenine(2030)-N(6))-methyltransferase RlmJ [Acidiferrobacter sp.]